MTHDPDEILIWMQDFYPMDGLQRS